MRPPSSTAFLVTATYVPTAGVEEELTFVAVTPSPAVAMSECYAQIHERVVSATAFQQYNRGFRLVEARLEQTTVVHLEEHTLSPREAEPTRQPMAAGSTPAPPTPSPAPVPDPPRGMAERQVPAGPAAESPESTADALKRIQGKHYRLGSKPADRQAFWNRYVGLKVTAKTASLRDLRALEAALDQELARSGTRA